jgi:uncharacterized protein YyaL (SSP411 family)
VKDDNEKAGYRNRLGKEDSPYLLQHANNPVDWYPWGDEAFDKARLEDKPVFLSIGYSTCHWCHVMEHESFDNDEIAKYLNEHFVAIKLDREQRPDLDDIYMTGTQLMTGHGGWPMSNFLSAEGKPFYSGTYFPPANFMQLLQQLTEVWSTRRNEVLAQADKMAVSIEQYTAAKSNNAQLGDLLTLAVNELHGRFDSVHGGFGDAPKFPNESQLGLVLTDWQRTGNKQSEIVLRLTLDRLYQGGIYDQIAGGFHRYSVDQHWLVPHFEKMLYSQAQLLALYAKAYGVLGDQAYKRVAIEIAEYVLRDMCSPDGAFYSATDADSEGGEGVFFVWSAQALEEELSKEDVELVTELYGVTENGNFEGGNILHLGGSLEEYAEDRSLTLDMLLKRLENIKNRLYTKREQRIHPLRDEKIITGWNSMMVSSLAAAATYLDKPALLAAALRAAEFLWEKHWHDEGLWRISLGGHPSITGNLEDYSAFAEATMMLYARTDEIKWLDRGLLIIQQMNTLFWDDEEGGYFLSHIADAGPLITRPKSPMDGATPSANSMAISALTQCWLMTRDPTIEQKLNAAENAFSGLLTSSPSAFSYMVTAMQNHLHGQRDPIQFAAEGKIRVMLYRTKDGFSLDLVLQEGWHVNGHETFGDLLPTTVLEHDDVIYPEGITRKLPFMDEEISLYEGHVSIAISSPSWPIALQLQACDDTQCLAPEQLLFAEIA